VNIVVFEDDRCFAKGLEEKIAGYGYQVVLNTDCLQMLQNHLMMADLAEVYLLDIMIGDSTEGIQAFRLINRSPRNHVCIFITNYLDYVLFNPEIKVNAFSFISKQSLEELPCTLALAYQQIKNNNLLVIHSKFNRTSITLAGIYYLESLNNRVIIYHEEGVFSVRARLQEMVLLLNSDFLQCHRSYVVNKRQIITYDFSNRILVLRDGFQCPFTKNRIGG